jgi:hypothetical protein
MSAIDTTTSVTVGREIIAKLKKHKGISRKD